MADASAATQEVVSVGGVAFQGELVSIDAAGSASFRVAEKKEQPGEVRTFPLDALVRWGHPVAPRPQPIAVFAAGGRLVTAADWAGGAAVRLAGDEIVLLSDTWNEVHFARSLVSGIVFAQQRRADERERLAEQVGAEPSPNSSLQGRGSVASDAVLLTNGDRVTGKLAELERGSLAIETMGGVAKVPLSRVEAITFGGHQPKNRDEPSPGPVRPSSPQALLQGRGKMVVGLRDGSLVYAKTVRADEKEVAIELANGVRLKGGAVDDVVALQSLGGRFVYLSDLEGADYRHVPYLTIAWPYMRDRNVVGGPIEVRGKRYLKGVGMHSAARLTHRLESDYRRFDSAVAIDDSAKGRGSVTFGVYLQRDGKWIEVYKSGIVRGGDPPQPVSIDLKGARGLTITVDFADRGDELDHAVWLDARLVR